MGKLNKDLVEQIYIELREGTTSSNIAIETANIALDVVGSSK